MLPIEHATFDFNLVLMRHKADATHFEIGWARDVDDKD